MRGRIQSTELKLHFLSCFLLRSHETKRLIIYRFYKSWPHSSMNLYTLISFSYSSNIYNLSLNVFLFPFFKSSSFLASALNRSSHSILSHHLLNRLNHPFNILIGHFRINRQRNNTLICFIGNWKIFRFISIGLFII